MQIERIVRPLVGALSVIAAGAPASGQCVVKEDAVFPVGAPIDGRFGSSVDARGEFAYVGAPGFSVPGRAYVLARTGLDWQQALILQPPHFDPNGEFGAAIACDDGWLAIGQPRKDGPLGFEEGRVEMFAGSGASWTHFVTLAGAGIVPGDEFGSGLSIDGGRLAVSAHRQGGKGTVHVFEWDGASWVPTPVLVASDGQADDHFGSALALDGNWLAVGASFHDDPATNAGAVYVFQRVSGTWTEQVKLTASDASALDQFGKSVALRQNTLLVGATGADGTTSDSGKAYVLLRQSGFWAEQGHFFGPFEPFGDFGRSVALGDDVALVGGGGEARVFHRSGTLWTPAATLTPGSGSGHGQFGATTSIDGETLLVGSPSASQVPLGSVGALMTWRDGGAVGTYCTAKVSSSGCVPQIAISGIPSVGGAPCTISASSLMNDKAGLLFYSTTGQHETPFQGGWLCMQPPLRRTPVQNSGGTGPCGGTFALDFSARIASGTDVSLVAGARFWGQYWSRDPGFAPPGNVNLTDAVYGTVCP